MPIRNRLAAVALITGNIAAAIRILVFCIRRQTFFFCREMAFQALGVLRHQAPIRNRFSRLWSISNDFWSACAHRNNTIALGQRKGLITNHLTPM